MTSQLAAKTDKYRCMWRDNPATTMVVGWNQITGSNPILYYDEVPRGNDPLMYAKRQAPDHAIQAKGMRNRFVRLKNLKPNTTYYFIIKDSDGVSRPLSFHTMPDNAYERLSIIAGGDSRNYRDARRRANALVGKLRPHFVLFAGDMTGGDDSKQWQQWFNDWQLTITPDGRLTPIVVARGNHEASNKTLIDLFDVPHAGVYYALHFGGDLLSVYTLNSMIASGGKQMQWLQTQLKDNSNTTWKMAQYHHSIRPHTAKKPEKLELQKNWSPLFHKYKVKVAIESDAHVVKTTYPIRPSNETGSDEGFIRDDENGTVYIGEGCWGAPLRDSNDAKKWTRSSGSFNQFKWLFIDQERIEIRTIKTDFAEQTEVISKHNVFQIPSGLRIWNPLEGDVIKIRRKKIVVADNHQPNTGNTKTTASPNGQLPKAKLPPISKLYASGGQVKVGYSIEQVGEVVLSLLNKKMQRIRKATHTHTTTGKMLQNFDVGGLPAGNYTLVVKQKNTIICRYELVKK
ncbi:MAG: metallophosphoesterase family protein [Bacteroidota bacterium]